MAKQTKTQINFEKTTVLFGYGLFAVVIIALIVSTVIPWATVLLHPDALQLNVALTMVSLVATALLPALLSYILGDRATHQKNKLLQHFNGVAFGVATYWLSLLCDFINTALLPSIYSSFVYPLAVVIAAWPIIAIIGVMAIIAVTYTTHSTRDRSVLFHIPYQVVLIGGLVGCFTYLFISLDASQIAAWLTNILYSGAVALAIAASYWRFGRLRRAILPRLTMSIIAVSIGLATSTFMAQIIPFSSLTSLLPVAIGAATWLLYLWLTTRRQ